MLQDEEFYRVGGTRSLLVDSRVVVATNRDLENEIANGRDCEIVDPRHAARTD